MTELILGLDSSCYTTSLAAVTADGSIFGSYRLLLPVEEGERGLRQSDAVFTHIRQYNQLFDNYRSAASDCRVTAVCASVRPRNRDDSYMPVFRVGETIGRGIASAMGIPFFSTSHQQGHIAAVLPGSGIDAEKPFLALHLSGGTTEMLYVDGEDMTLIGGSKDLHAGQLVDRTGVLLGTGFPAGLALEAMAIRGISQGILPSSMDEDTCWCHFSGAENGIRKMIKDGIPREQVAKEVYDLLARTILKMIIAGTKKTNAHAVLLAGGVSSSALFRSMLEERAGKRRDVPLIAFGKPEFSGDNAFGVARIGWQKWKKEGLKN